MSSPAENEELRKQRREDAHRQHDKHFDATLKAFDTVIGFSVPAMRAPGIINAGAFASILAFLSQMDGGQHSDARILAGTLFYFISGVALSSLAHGSAYFAQMFFHYSTADHGYYYEYPFVRAKEKMRKLQIAGISFHFLTIAMVAISYILFFVGAYKAYLELINIYSK